MKQDRVPIASNSSDKRRPILTTSPADRQKKIKELKTPSKEAIVKEEFENYKQEFRYSEQEVAIMLSESNSRLAEEYKKEILKLTRELDKKNKKILELTKQSTITE